MTSLLQLCIRKLCSEQEQAGADIDGGAQGLTALPQPAPAQNIKVGLRPVLHQQRSPVHVHFMLSVTDTATEGRRSHLRQALHEHMAAPIPIVFGFSSELGKVDGLEPRMPWTLQRFPFGVKAKQGA